MTRLMDHFTYGPDGRAEWAWPEEAQAEPMTPADYRTRAITWRCIVVGVVAFWVAVAWWLA